MTLSVPQNLTGHCEGLHSIRLHNGHHCCCSHDEDGVSGDGCEPDAALQNVPGPAVSVAGTRHLDPLHLLRRRPGVIGGAGEAIDGAGEVGREAINGAG